MLDPPAAAGGGAPSGSRGCCGEVTLSFFCFVNKASGERSGGPGGAVRSGVEVLPAARLARVRSLLISGVSGRQIKLLGQIDAATEIRPAAVRASSSLPDN